MKLVLASKSGTRRAMLEAAGVPFEAKAAEIDEEDVKAALRREGLGAIALAEALAERKALSLSADPNHLILGSDQTLELDDGIMLDKPASLEEARSQLLSLSGRIHHLHAAAVIAEDGARVWNHVETVSLTVRPLGADFIDEYLAQEYETIRWSVGGYRIEGTGVQLFERTEGSHFAILGLPLIPLLSYLRARSVLAS